MKISIKCHDCKMRYVEELDVSYYTIDGVLVDTSPAGTFQTVYCKNCFSDALFAEPLYWLDRNPRAKFAAQLFIVFCVGFALAGLLVECGARLGG